MSTFRHSREIAARPEAVFEAFRNPERLARGAAGTLVSWVGVFEDREFADKARQFLEGANEQNLDRLALEVSRVPQGVSA